MQNKLTRWAQLAISISLLTYLFYHIDFSRITAIAANLQSSLILKATLLSIIATVACKSLLVANLLHGSFKGKFFRLIVINLKLRYFSIILPRPAVSALRWYMYSTLCDAKKAFAILSIESYTYITVMLATGLIAIKIDPRASSTHTYYLATALAALCILPLTLRLTVKFKKKFLGFSYKTRFTAAANIIDRLTTLLQYLNEQSLKPKTIYFTLLLSLISFLLFIGSSFLLAESLELKISIISLTWIRALIMVLTMLPITLGGIGIREAGFVYFFSAYDISSEEALSYSLSTYFIQLIIAFLGAATEFSQRIITYAKR